MSISYDYDGSRFDLGDESDERIYGTRARESEVQRGDDGQYLWLFGADSHMASSCSKRSAASDHIDQT